MPKPGASSASSALFLTPEDPKPGAGGGGLRSASLLEYLRQRYAVEVARFTLPVHSKNILARVWRNGWRFVRNSPPLLDRFAGFEAQLMPVLNDRRYVVGVIEHFWCAPYARSLRPHCDRLVLDLHNIESELASTHAQATHGFESVLHRRFAAAYRRLERTWLPEFDTILVPSEEDRSRIQHPDIRVYPNALPLIDRPSVAERDCIAFSGNLEYHPNIEAVRWFRSQIWPRIKSSVEWRLVGRNPHAVQRIVAGDPRITLTGPVTDAVAALAEAKICVVPLLSGSGTRFKILEAWAAARAVVSTSLGAEGLGARSGEHLLIAETEDAFAAAINWLLADPDLRRRLGNAGRALYLERFTWQAAWKSIEGL